MIAIGEQLSEEEADEMIKDADVNGDGRVDYQGINPFTLRAAERGLAILQIIYS